MATNTSKADKTRTAKPAGTRMTAAQRRKHLEEQRQAEREQWSLAFQAEGAMRWYRFLAYAFILAHRVGDGHPLRDEHSWWFDSFEVDAAQETVTVEGKTYAFAGDSFTFETVDRAEADLKTGRDFYEAYLAEQERQRQEELRRQELQKSALSKLTPEEIEAVRLGHLVRR